jgi:hypothetical protein
MRLAAHLTQGKSPGFLCLFHVQSFAVHISIDIALSNEAELLGITWSWSKDDWSYSAEEDAD